MDLVDKHVMHKTFGKGNVINYDDSYIMIKFTSGEKKFVFPDVFRKHITLIDQKAARLVNEIIEAQEKQQKKEELILKKEKALEQEQQNILNQRKNMKVGKIHDKIQSVFWCEPDELDEIFNEWKVFTGEIKSGKNKGQPRKLTRMNQNSACIITTRNDNMPEEERQILGIFMASDYFNGALCEDGYITSNPKYQIHLSKEESEKMLFWNYYKDDKSPDKAIWKSGRHRYFDNIWAAQMLKDVASLKEDPKDQEYVQVFFEHFCRINLINQNELPQANGALISEKNSK